MSQYGYKSNKYNRKLTTITYELKKKNKKYIHKIVIITIN